MNTIGDKLNTEDEDKKINEVKRSNNVEKDNDDETTIDNDRPQRGNSGNGVNTLKIYFDENTFENWCIYSSLLKERSNRSMAQQPTCQWP